MTTGGHVPPFSCTAQATPKQPLARAPPGRHLHGRQAAQPRAFLFSPDDEAEDGHYQVNQTLRGGKQNDVFMVRGQPSLYAQVLLNAGRDEKAGQQGIRPEKESLRKRCGGEYGRAQRLFAFADGVNQRDGSARPRRSSSFSMNSVWRMRRLWPRRSCRSRTR